MKTIISLTIALLVAGAVVGCGSSEAENAGPPPPHISGPSKSDVISTSKPSLANPTLSGNASKK